jgi:hypothetical protein
MTDIYTALAAVMSDCDHVAKRDRNEHQRFLFRGIDAVVNAVGPVLRKHGVIVTPHLQDVVYDTVQTSQGKPATACRVQVAYIFYAPDGSSIETVVAAEAWDMGDKAAPKAMSVAFRTALLQALALPTDEPDPDSQSFERQQREFESNDAWVHGSRPDKEAKAKATTRTMRRAAKPKLPDSEPQNGTLPIENGEQMTEKQLGMLMPLFIQAGVHSQKSRHDYAQNVIGRPIEKSTEMTKREASKVIEALLYDVENPPPDEEG